ncbi:MAG: SLC13 family permease [Thermoanaerobaculia bacterium]
MTFEIGLVLGVLGLAVVLFITEWVRVDVVALIVMVSLALTGLVEPKQALSGFSNPAVITVWAVFILSGGLARTGIASLLGRQVLRLAAGGERRLVVTIMLTSGFLSAFMNNVGVAALLLPVVMDISRRTRIPPSKLLIPLAFSSLLGGLTTLIGTPPNILVSEALEQSGRDPFSMFDFTPVGSSVVLAGILFMTFFGSRLLPSRDPRVLSAGADDELARLYSLQEQLFFVDVPLGSGLAGKTLAESRLGSALELNVIAILRKDKTKLAPHPETTLAVGDRLLVEGPREPLVGSDRKSLDLEAADIEVEQLISADIEVVNAALLPGCSLIGETLISLNFRHSYGGCIVLAIKSEGMVIRRNLESRPLREGDRLLIQGRDDQLEKLRQNPHIEVAVADDANEYRLDERLMVVAVPEESPFVGKSLVESRLGHAYGIGVMGIVRGGKTLLMPDADEIIWPNDSLLVKGSLDDLETLQGLQGLESVTREVEPSLLESESVGLAEVVLSPRSALAGRTLADLHFREKYGMNVVAISRAGETIRKGLRDEPLFFGDALLLHGARDKLQVLAKEPDFLVLTEEASEPIRSKLAPVSALLMAAVVGSVVAGFLPIYIAAVCGALLMVLSGCLTMDEAYRAIEWRAVFLIAGMLPLGIALERTGAALFLTTTVVGMVGDFGPMAVVAALFLTTALAAQVMPTAAVAILMAPIALNTAMDLGYSPQALLMAVALSASASFMSPVAHPANTLIMGPGGYRFADYIKVGLPLTLVCLITVLLLLPLIWPIQP